MEADSENGMPVDGSIGVATDPCCGPTNFKRASDAAWIIGGLLYGTEAAL
jgi:hypothetical protein